LKMATAFTEGGTQKAKAALAATEDVCANS
jgi:hypothetical protein